MGFLAMGIFQLESRLWLLVVTHELKLKWKFVGFFVAKFLEFK